MIIRTRHAGKNHAVLTIRILLLVSSTERKLFLDHLYTRSITLKEKRPGSYERLPRD